MQRNDFVTRAKAAGLDGIFLFTTSVVTLFAGGMAVGQRTGTVAPALMCLAYSTLEIYWARSPGKIFLDLTITAEDGQPTTRNALVRRWCVKSGWLVFNVLAAATGLQLFNLLTGLGSLASLVGFLVSLNPDNEPFHDQFASTTVGPMQATPASATPTQPQLDTPPVRKAA